MTRSFTAQLDDIIGLTLDDMEYVQKQSIQDVLVGAQTTQIGITQGAEGFEEGKIPVGLTAELVNSLTVDGSSGESAYVVAIAGMEIGDSLDFAWTADHALPIETGWTTSKGTQVPGRYFVTRNAEQYSEHVNKRVAEVRR